MVRLGFRGSDEGLPDRVRKAKCLAFHYAEGDALAAISGLKRPTEEYRAHVFEKAGAPVSPAGYHLELGWVFVLPDHRRKRIGWD